MTPRVPSLEGVDPTTLRKRALTRLHDLGVGDGAIAYQVRVDATAGRGPGWVLGAGASSVVDLAERLMTPELSGFVGSVVDFARATRRERTRYVTLGELVDVDWLRSSVFWDRVYAPHRVGWQARRLVFEQDRLVAWVGVVRADGAPDFDAADLRALGGASDVVHDLVWADRIESAGTPEAGADLVCDAAGHVLLRSSAAAAWLAQPGLQDQVRALIRDVDQGRFAAGTAVRAATLEVTRLEGDGAVRYLVRVTSNVPVAIGASHALTDRERQVCAFAASGATADEIARSLGVSPETVRSHLRHAYAKLGVTSRLELHRVLRDLAS